jgi:hypothetical protein
MTHPFWVWLTAFVWTNALELPVYVLALRRRFDCWWMPCVLAFVLNVVTHPALWYVFPRISPFWLYAVCGEAAVVCIEAVGVKLALRKRGTMRFAFGVSLAANTVSTVVGLALTRWWW